MFRIAICDDEKDMCNIIEKMVLAAAGELGLPVETEVFCSGESLFTYLMQGNCFDLIFLDIEMAGMDGLDISQKIRNDLDDIDTEIVYVTCTTEYDRRLFDFHPLAFIAKPPEKTQIMRALDLALKKRNLRDPYFSFTYNRQVIQSRITEFYISKVTIGKLTSLLPPQLIHITADFRMF